MSPSGVDAGDGTSAKAPLRTVGFALSIASKGDVLLIADGVYREGIESTNGGAPNAPITLRAEPNAHPILAGSIVALGWSHVEGSVWSTPWDAATTNPPGCSGGECPGLSWGAPQEVFVDGARLQQIAGILPSVHPACPSPTDDACRTPVGTGLADLDAASGRFFYDDSAKKLYVRLADDSDPTGHQVEVPVQRRVLFFYPSAPGWICVEGLTFRHSNASAHYRQMAGVTLLGSSTLSNSVVEDMDLAGVSTSSVVSHSIVRRNGQLGLSVNEGAELRDSLVERNNVRAFNEFWEAGGMKSVSPGAIVERVRFRDNNGPGVWLDGAKGTANEHVRVRNNWLDGNDREGQIFVELSDFAEVTNNVVVNTGRTADENVRGIIVSESSSVYVGFNTVVSLAPSFAFDGLSGVRAPFEDLTLESNVFVRLGSAATHTDVRVAEQTSWASDHDVYFGAPFTFGYGPASPLDFAAWQTTTMKDASSKVVDPGFVDANARHFEPIAQSSIARSVPRSDRVQVDYAGRARPNPATPGALEACE